MDKINRLKVGIIEKRESDKWLPYQPGKSICAINNWLGNTTQTALLTLNKIAQLM